MKIKDKKLFELLKEYLTVYLTLQKVRSPNTVKAYRETLNLFLDFLCEYKQKKLRNISFEDISDDSINEFLFWLEKVRHCGLPTLNHRLSVIRGFLKYAGMKNPAYNDYYLQSSQVAWRKSEKSFIVRHFSEEALAAILKQPNPKSKIGHRDLFYMILLYDTGARDREILELKPQDIILEGNTPYVVIRGKGNKIRMIPIMQDTVLHYKSYIKRFHSDGTQNCPLFYTVIHGEKQVMSDDNVARFLKKYSSLAQIDCAEVPSKVTPHMFRHSRALHLYRKGVPLPLISEWLGHSNLETTLIYAYADTEMKRIAIEKATDANHPLRNNKSLDVSSLDEDSLKILYGLK